MRLLDQVSQTTTPFLVVVPEKSTPVRLFGAIDIAETIRNAPIRYVCEEYVSELCAQTAIGLRFLERCLDLVHIPARQLWVEWDERVRNDVLSDSSGMDGSAARRAGAIVEVDECGRRGSFQTCWQSSDARDVVDVSPVLAEFDFDDPAFAFVEGEDYAPVGAETPAVDHPILRHMRFRLRKDWLAYYKERCDERALRRILLQSAQYVFHDFLFLLALTLLLEASGGPLSRRCVQRDLINRKGRGSGKPALLDHVELVGRLGPHLVRDGQHGAGVWERHRRLHVVRGHLVRRGAAVYWRKSHWRGDAARGLIASRTITLRRAS